MRPSLYCVSWYSPIGLPNCLRSLTYVAVASSAACARPRRAAAGLEAAGGEALHLEIEALALARRRSPIRFSAGHEVAVEARA